MVQWSAEFTERFRSRNTYTWLSKSIQGISWTWIFCLNTNCAILLKIIVSPVMGYERDNVFAKKDRNEIDETDLLANESDLN